MSASRSGAARFDDAIESYLASRSDTAPILKRALADEPEHLMARCFLGCLLRLAGDPASSARARDQYHDLESRIAGGAGTAWERAHVAALGLWLADDLRRLMAHYQALVQDHPNDLLALRMLHYLYFYDGDAAAMRDSVAAALPHYQGHPLESYVEGMLAFALEECGDYPAAERHGRAAVEARPHDAWAAHAVAHVMEMQGRIDDGIHWVRALRPRWRETNNFRFHLYWHEALYHLARRDLDAVLSIYDDEVGPAVADDFYLDMCNAASLLLRLEAVGVDVGNRWQPLAAIAERHADDSELVFASLHHLMPLLRAGSPAGQRLLATIEAWACRDTSQGQVARDVAVDAAAFLVALATGDKAAAAARFDAFRHRLHRIGGSHAQRRLFFILHDQTTENA